MDQINEFSDQITSPFFDGTVTSDAADEYTLPDYFPEIRRILSVSARALPENKFVSDQKIEFGGTVVFTVMYVGDSGELAGIPYAFAYTASSALPEPPKTLSSFTVDTRAESPQCRVLAPRRISLKTRLRSHILADQTRRTNVAVTASDGTKVTPADVMSIERKTETMPTARRFSASATGAVTGSIRESEPMKLVSCDGAVTVNSAIPRDGAVNVTGDAEITAICQTESGMYITCRAKTPIEETVSCDGVTEGMAVRATCLCASSGVTIPDGDPTMLRYEMEYDISVEAISHCSGNATSDMYSTQYEMSLVPCECDVLAPFWCGTMPLSVDGSVSDDGSGYIISRNADAWCDKIELNGDRAFVSGTCAVKALLGGDELRSAEITIPFRAEMRAAQGDIGDGCEAAGRCDISVTSVTVRLDGDKLSATAELSLSCTVLARKRVRVLSSAELLKNQPVPHEDGVIRMYYPSPEDTCWSIAKQYHSPLAEFERTNGAKLDGSPVIV